MSTPAEWSQLLGYLSNIAANGATTAERARIVAVGLTEAASAMNTTAAGLLNQVVQTAELGAGANRAVANRILGQVAGNAGNAGVSAARAAISHSIKSVALETAGSTALVTTGTTELTTAAVSTGARLMIGGLLITGIMLLIYLGVNQYHRYQDIMKRANANEPESNNVNRDSDGSSEPNREPGDFRPSGVSKPPQRTAATNGNSPRLISVPPGYGVEEIVPRPRSSQSAVCVAAGTAQIMRRKKWEQKIDSMMSLYKMEGDWKGSWSIPKADLKQSGWEVGGHMWITVEVRDDAYVTRKVAIKSATIVRKSGKKEYVDVDLGFAQGRLAFQSNGNTVHGEIDGVFVVLSNVAASDERKQLVKRHPFPG